jgi:hypothetical protein
VAPTGGTTTAAALPELQKQVTSGIEQLTSALQGVKDQASANSALPKIQAASRDMERLALQSVQLPADARATLANATREPLAKLNAAIDGAASQPGVGPVIQPAIAGLRNRADAIAMAPGKPLFIASAPAEWVPLSGIQNRDVLDRAGDRLGTASGFYVGPDGRIVASVVSVDRQLGIGDRQVAMPFSGQLTRKGDGWHLVIDASKDDLQHGKPFEAGK